MYINLYYPTPDYMPDTSLIGAGLNENAIEYDAITSQSSVSRALQSVFGTIETAGGGIITFTGIVLSALGAPEIGIPLAMTGGALSTNGVQNIQEPIYFYSGGEHGKSYSPYSGLDILWGAGVEAIRATIPGAQFFPSWGDWGLQWNWSTGRLEWR